MAADRELVADATVEARRFLARVKPRTLKTDKGRTITTTELAVALVERAAIEHAVVEWTRPSEIRCMDCLEVRQVPSVGAVPRRCVDCAYAHATARQAERRRARTAQASR